MYALAWSHNGTLAACLDNGGVALMRRSEGGDDWSAPAPYFTARAHKERTADAAWVPRRNVLCTVSTDRWMKLWACDADGGARLLAATFTDAPLSRVTLVPAAGASSEAAAQIRAVVLEASGAMKVFDVQGSHALSLPS